MKRLSVLLLTLLILLTSCGELHYVEAEAPETTESPEAPAEGWTPADLSNIDGIDTVFSNNKFTGSCPRIRVDGEFVYVWPRGSGLFYRFSLITGKITKVCTDPLCVGEECPFAKGSDNWVLAGDFVYYIREDSGYAKDPETGRGKLHWEYSIHRYDMKNQKNECLYEIPDDGRGYTLFDILSDGYLYYTRRQQIESADKKAYAEVFVCRCKPEEIGKSEEVLYKLDLLENGYDNLLEVTEEYFCFLSGPMNTNLVTRVSRKDGSADLMTYPFYGISTARVGDYCYYLSCQGEPAKYVTSTDGKGEVIVDENGDPILTPLYERYYTKRNLLTLEETVWEKAPGYPSNIPGYVTDVTDNYLYLDFEDGLWRCDHDGNKLRLVRSQEQLDARPIKSIDDRLIYGNWIFESDAETFVVYDMESGKYFTFELE